ncbi:hypothetical protein ABT299_42070 [Spirillospora sp. NPDC000708]
MSGWYRQRLPAAALALCLACAACGGGDHGSRGASGAGGGSVGGSQPGGHGPGAGGPGGPGAGNGDGGEAPGSPMRVPELDNPPVSQRAPENIREVLLAQLAPICRSHGWTPPCVDVEIHHEDLGNPDKTLCLGDHLDPAEGAPLRRGQTIVIVTGDGPCLDGGSPDPGPPDPGSPEPESPPPDGGSPVPEASS